MKEIVTVPKNRRIKTEIVKERKTRKNEEDKRVTRKEVTKEKKKAKERN